MYVLSGTELDNIREAAKIALGRVNGILTILESKKAIGVGFIADAKAAVAKMSGQVDSSQDQTFLVAIGNGFTIAAEYVSSSKITASRFIESITEAARGNFAYLLELIKSKQREWKEAGKDTAGGGGQPPTEGKSNLLLIVAGGVALFVALSMMKK